MTWNNTTRSARDCNGSVEKVNGSPVNRGVATGVKKRRLILSIDIADI